MPWKDFFRLEAARYDEECFVQNTEAEVAFLLEVLDLPEGAAVLDVGCGTGRHSIALALRGFSVTGIDLSEAMLDRAREKAAAAGARVTFLQADATSFESPPVYDAAIGLCEGAMGLLGSQDDPMSRDLAVLQSVFRALKPGGRLVLNALNAFRMARLEGQDPQGGAFDPMTQTRRIDMTFQTGERPVTIPCRERWFTPTELTLLLRFAGFEVEHLWGGTAGNWRRGPMTLDEIEMMAVARKA